jgi:hypothetical protein
VSLFGSFPPSLLEPLQDHLRDVVEATQDLVGAQRSLNNAYTLYLKTRPAASSESAKRARGVPPEGPHPLLVSRLPASRLADLRVGREGGGAGAAAWYQGLGGRGLQRQRRHPGPSLPPSALVAHHRKPRAPASQTEAALAQFTQRLKSFRPAATVLEAEIAKVRRRRWRGGEGLWRCASTQHCPWASANPACNPPGAAAC